MPPPPATFGKIKYVSDPYKPPIVIVAHGNSSKGVRQMTGGKGIKSKLNRLYEGEKPSIARGQVNPKKVTECKFLTSDGFRYSSAMKESNNRGDYTATFTKNIEHIPISPISKPESDMEQSGGRTTKTRFPVALKNVSTAPYNDAVFNKIPYVTQSVDKVPTRRKKTDKAPSFSFTKKNELFNKIAFVPQTVETKHGEEDAKPQKPKDPTILDCGSFRPSNPCINSKAPISGTFSPTRYEGTSYDEKLRRRVTTPDKLHALPPHTKVWID